MGTFLHTGTFLHRKEYGAIVLSFGTIECADKHANIIHVKSVSLRMGIRARPHNHFL